MGDGFQLKSGFRAVRASTTEVRLPLQAGRERDQSASSTRVTATGDTRCPNGTVEHCRDSAADDSHQERHDRHGHRSLQRRCPRRGREDHDDRFGADDAGGPRDRRGRQVRAPGWHRRPHPPRHALRRHHLGRRLRVRHHRRGPRRHDDDRRLRHPVPGADAASRVGDVDEEGRGQGGHRLRLPHDRDRHLRSGGAGDGRAGPRRGHVLQAVHGLPGRVHAGRRQHLPRAAADRQRTAARSACTPRTAA